MTDHSELEGLKIYEKKKEENEIFRNFHTMLQHL